MVLVEEAKNGGTKHLVPQCVDRDLRLLAGLASPASVTVNDDGEVTVL